MTAPVAVIGMHRSGTSLVSRILQDLGVFMGYRQDENAEARLFRRANDWALRRGASRWDEPWSFREELPRLLPEIRADFHRRLRSSRRWEYLGFRALRHRDVTELREPWGWKDPRTTFLVEVWRQVVPDLQVVHVVRHPVDVAASLAVREESVTTLWRRGLSLARDRGSWRVPVRSRRARTLEGGLALWDCYVSAARALPAGMRGLVFHELGFEQLLGAPERTVAWLASRLGLEADPDRVRSAARRIRPGRELAWKRSEPLRRVEASLPEGIRAAWSLRRGSR